VAANREISRAEIEGVRSVQEYIDELPAWSDGTRLKSPPMTGMQWRIWSLAAAGKFFEGFVVFMTGIALPLIVRVRASLAPQVWPAYWLAPFFSGAYPTTLVGS
jgi:hypothetical protein